MQCAVCRNLHDLLFKCVPAVETQKRYSIPTKALREIGMKKYQETSREGCELTHWEHAASNGVVSRVSRKLLVVL